MTPIRIQRSRAKGWRMPPDTVYVGRGSAFGNLSACCHPHNCARDFCACCPHSNLDDYCCVDNYREFVVSGIEGRHSYRGTLNVCLDAMAGYPYRTRLIKALPRLRGKNLACWCALDKPCHADVLLELANRGAAPP